MNKPRRLINFYATIFLVFVLALAVSAMAHHGFVSKTSGTSGTNLAGGPPPPDDDSDTGNIKLAGGPPPPDDDSDTGNIRLAGGPPPPDDDSDTGNIRLASVGAQSYNLQ
jgi:hypothetical protein